MRCGSIRAAGFWWIKIVLAMEMKAINTTRPFLPAIDNSNIERDQVTNLNKAIASFILNSIEAETNI